ncbi:hypothetical protein D3C73_1059450 [compost metagenome]
MRYPLAKQGFGGTDLVHMSIKMVTAEAGKINDVGFGHRTACGEQAFAQPQLFKVFTERMNRILNHRSPAYPLAANRRQHCRAALDRRALHVVFYRP